MAEIKQPELLAYDGERSEGGNVRPADDRHLTATQKRKRNAYVAKVEEAQADAEANREAGDDPLAPVLQDAVNRALTDPASPRADVTPVTSSADNTTGDPA